jgi:hypothetical protein
VSEADAAVDLDDASVPRGVERVLGHAGGGEERRRRSAERGGEHERFARRIGEAVEAGAHQRFERLGDGEWVTDRTVRCQLERAERIAAGGLVDPKERRSRKRRAEPRLHEPLRRADAERADAESRRLDAREPQRRLADTRLALEDEGRTASVRAVEEGAYFSTRAVDGSGVAAALDVDFDDFVRADPLVCEFDPLRAVDRFAQRLHPQVLEQDHRGGGFVR